MKIPSQLKILGRNYKVIEKEEKETTNDNMGTCWGKYSLIYINKCAEPQFKEATLLHEILEAVNQMQDIGLKHSQVKRLETSIYQVLKENDLDFRKRRRD